MGNCNLPRLKIQPPHLAQRHTLNVTTPEKVIANKSIRFYGSGAIKGHFDANVCPIEFRYIDGPQVFGVSIEGFGSCGTIFRTCINIEFSPRHVSNGNNNIAGGLLGYGSAPSLFLRGEAALIGYARVSKPDGSQTLALQHDALLEAGVSLDRIYEDLASGRNDARPGLIACLKALQPGNTLILWKLDRLGRDLRHLVNTVEDLRMRGVGLKVLTGAGAQIDTTTANGRLAFGIFVAFAEFERELIAERTQAGLAAARARGRMGGRPRKMDKATLTMAMAAMADPKAVAADVAKRLGITTTMLYYYVNGDGSPKAAGHAVLDPAFTADNSTKLSSRQIEVV
ncbi:recombinase family protein [Bacillus subtilis]|nr:recombinase family protein [Pseudochrobactrum asaccharolyticum]MCF7673627.1 recombinase family protein [Bacillus subtilis]